MVTTTPTIPPPNERTQQRIAQCGAGTQAPASTMRRRLLAASAGGLAVALPHRVRANAGAPLVFSPSDRPARAQAPQPAEPLQLGQIPRDFWERPRTLWLHRKETGEQLRVAYFERGQLVPQAYWQVCTLMRDVRANVMTAMDPALLDVLRGIMGYYEAWGWNYPLVINSGYRTERTNRALAAEGAAKNSLHLSGRAADVWMPGIPTRDVGALGMHFRQGGVGFYPSKGFVHLDTGRTRTWRG